MADNLQFTNDASALLSASINAAVTTLSVEPGFGASFPSPTGSQYFYAALQNADGDLEIVKVTARTADNFTIVRGQDGTVAQSWTLGVTRFELRLTAAVMEELVQKNGGTMTGTLNMNGETIQDAVLDGTGTVLQGGQIVAVPLRGALDDSSNEVAVPDDGSRATASGFAVLTQADLANNGGLNLLPVGSLLMWYGVLATLPSGWQLCNGSNGTPDLRGVFPIGAGGALSLGATGGSATASGSTGSGGTHDHGAATGSHTLTEDEIPSHIHNVRGAGGPGTVVSRPNISDAGTYGLGGAAYSSGGPNQGDVDVAPGDGASYIRPTGGDAAHSHTVASDGSHTHTLSSISTVPPYVAVYFVMRVS